MALPSMGGIIPSSKGLKRTEGGRGRDVPFFFSFLASLIEPGHALRASALGHQPLAPRPSGGTELHHQLSCPGPPAGRGRSRGFPPSKSHEPISHGKSPCNIFPPGSLSLEDAD